MDKNTIRTASQLAFTITNTIIKHFGARPSCSEQSNNAAKVLQFMYSIHCDSSQLETFTTHPSAFLGFLTLVPWIYIACLIFIILHCYIIAAVGFTISIIIATSQFIFYKGTFDFLYTQKEGTNAIGSIEPSNDVRQQIIISGHHDSAYEFRYMRTTPRLYRIRVASIILSILLSFLLGWLIVVNAYTFDSATAHTVLLTFLIILGIANMQMLFFKSKHATPGAGDNLIASTITVALANIFANYRPNYTRIIFASFDAEESGLKGSKAFATSHKHEIGSMPTFHFNMDSLYKVDLIQFLTSDVNGFVPLSKELARQCVAIAHAMGYPAKTFAMYPGTGATDAAPVAQAGAIATTLIALPTEVEKQHSVYHTMDDTTSNIQPEVVEAAIAIAVKLVHYIDNEIRGYRWGNRARQDSNLWPTA